jgi:hypothetical protein
MTQKERQSAFELVACSFFQEVHKGVVEELVGREIDGLPIGQHEIYLLDAFSPLITSVILYAAFNSISTF